jgi:site-specific DNA-cytosine methylase
VRVLSLNTYGGSLLLGARNGGFPLVGSYEDVGYGSDIQAVNFPDVPLVRDRKDWPAQNLKDTFVIAHPPCSAFSLQTRKERRGLDTDAFACTKHVLRYAMENKAIGVAVESVMGALGGAWPLHQQFADDFGYYPYRILENGCMFGAQWRERFWILYLRKGVANPTIELRLTPHYQTVSEVVDGYLDGPAPHGLDRYVDRYRQRFIEEVGCTPAEISYLFDEQDPPHKTMLVGAALWDLKFKRPDSKPADRDAMFEKYIGGFDSASMCYLDPNGLAPVLLGQSWWYYRGRNLSETGYKRLMGFPADYTFPDKPKNHHRNMRTYLSKGVMPPIAQWVLEEAAVALGFRPRTATTEPTYMISCEPNRVADFRIRRKDWYERHAHNNLPPLRNQEEIEIALERKAIVLPFTPRTKPVKPAKVKSAPKSVPTVRQECKIEYVSHDGLSVSARDQRRGQLLHVVKSLSSPTLGEAIVACLNDPAVNVQESTIRWHLRQLIQGGQLREA